VNPVDDCCDPEKKLLFRALEEPWNSLINRVKSSLLVTPYLSDWLDSLISPIGLQLIVSQLFAVPVSVVWVGLDELVPKLDVRNILLGLPILRSRGESALITAIPG
jgi:hypothetical protein